MPFIPHTPESLISRSDSKNPATTCKGITGRGRPCRRDLAPKANNGVLALAPVQGVDGLETDAAAFFCWQHKDQAERLVQESNNSSQNDNGQTMIIPLQQRTSLDTLYERLGVLEEEETPKKGSERRIPSSKSGSRKPHRPPTWENVPGPIMTVPRRTLPPQEGLPPLQKADMSKRPKQAKFSFFEILCCGAVSDDSDYTEVVRHRRRTEQSISSVHRPDVPQHYSARRQTNPRQSPVAARKAEQPFSRSHSAEIAELSAMRPSIPHQSSSHTSNLLSLIPKHLNPQVTSQLLTELSKPISTFDEEGYIYIFQLTSQEPSGAPGTPAKAAKLLTADTSPLSQARRPSAGGRSVSGVSTSSNRASGGKLLLKIGRASNVQRRMNEWTRQCNYALELVRWYPHISSSSASASPSSRRLAPTPSPHRPSPAAPTQRRASDSPLVRKISHSHRVERLIHIELAEKRVRRACEVCGKEHREWFEIEVGREGVREVDEVVKRWVEWDESTSSDVRTRDEIF